MSGNVRVTTEIHSEKIFLGAIPPDDENCKIWRYMDLSKFVWMIQNKALFFSNFKNFQDPFEGQFPYGNVKEISKLIRQEDKDLSEKEALEKAKIYVKNTHNAIHEYADYFINCWHINDYESEAMWKIYSELDMGIAIQSTYKSLDECLSKHWGNQHIFVGVVKYLKPTEWIHELKYIYEPNYIHENNRLSIYTPFFYKRISFEYEKEVRAIFEHPHSANKPNMQANNCGCILEYKDDSKIVGFQVPISLKELIKNIYISPKASDCITMLVKTILKDYGCEDINVIRSSLYDVNLY